MNVRPVAVIFDMDGLLVDSEPIWHEAEHEVARMWDAPWSEEDALACTGKGIPGAAARLAAAAHRTFDPEAHPRLLVDTFLARADRVAPKPGARAIVRMLRSLGIPLGLGSSSPLRVVATLLAAQALDDGFSAIVTADDVEQVKPDPEIFLRVAERLAIAPPQCIVIEDSWAGVTAAKRAGMAVIAVPDRGGDTTAVENSTKELARIADAVASDLDHASRLVSTMLGRA